MSSSMFVLQSCTGISILLSAIYFIISTIYMDDIMKHYSSYANPDVLSFFVVLSIWLALFELGVNILIFKRLEHTWKFWCLNNLFVFALAAIVFGVAMAEKVQKLGGSTGSAFLGFTAIKFIFSSIASIVIFLLGRQDAFSPGY